MSLSHAVSRFCRSRYGTHATDFVDNGILLSVWPELHPCRVTGAHAFLRRVKAGGYQVSALHFPDTKTTFAYPFSSWTVFQ